MVVWKYQLPKALCELDMPRGAKVIFVGVKKGFICLWVEVEPQLPKEVRRFRVVWTGNKFNSYGSQSFFR